MSDTGATSPSIEELQKQLAALQQQLSQMSSQTPTKSSKGIKVALPDPFDGTTSKAETFMNQLTLYFFGKRSDFVDDTDKIIFALSYMKGGNAGPWADQKVQELSGDTPPFTDWSSFKESFEEVFGDPDPASSARFRMDQLKQGALSAEDFVAKFRELAPKTGYNDAAHIEKFEKGLNSALVDKIYALADMPKTLSEWMSWSIKLDRQWRQREAKKKLLSSPSPSKAVIKPTPVTRSPLAQTLPTPTKQSEVVPMEVDSGRRNVGPRVCFKCRKPGHIARDCQSQLDINSLDFDGLKAFMKAELQKEGF